MCGTPFACQIASSAWWHVPPQLNHGKVPAISARTWVPWLPPVKGFVFHILLLQHGQGSNPNDATSYSLLSAMDFKAVDDMDPSLADGHRIMYDREVPFELRTQVWPSIINEPRTWFLLRAVVRPHTGPKIWSIKKFAYPKGSLVAPPTLLPTPCKVAWRLVFHWFKLW